MLEGDFLICKKPVEFYNSDVTLNEYGTFNINRRYEITYIVNDLVYMRANHGIECRFAINKISEFFYTKKDLLNKKLKKVKNATATL